MICLDQEFDRLERVSQKLFFKAKSSPIFSLFCSYMLQSWSLNNENNVQIQILLLVIYWFLPTVHIKIHLNMASLQSVNSFIHKERICILDFIQICVCWCLFQDSLHSFSLFSRKASPTPLAPHTLPALMSERTQPTKKKSCFASFISVHLIS